MSEEPEFDIYPELDREIKKATEPDDGTKPEDVAVGGLAEVVSDEISEEVAGGVSGYDEAEKKVQELFKDFPEREFFEGSVQFDGNRVRHKYSARDLKERQAELKELRDKLEKSSWHDKLLYGGSGHRAIESKEIEVSRVNDGYDKIIEESKKDIVSDQVEALLAIAMTDVYNQIFTELGKVYMLEVKPGPLDPAELTEEINQANVIHRDDQGNYVTWGGEGRLDSVGLNPKKQVIALALKNVFTPATDTVSGQHPRYKGPRRSSATVWGSTLDKAEIEAETMGSEYILRVRQTINGSTELAKANGKKPEYFIPIDNFTAVLINYLLEKNGQPPAGEINAVEPLDCQGELNVPKPTDDSVSLYSAYDLVKFTEANQGDIEVMNLVAA